MKAYQKIALGAALIAGSMKACGYEPHINNETAQQIYNTGHQVAQARQQTIDLAEKISYEVLSHRSTIAPKQLDTATIDSLVRTYNATVQRHDSLHAHYDTLQKDTSAAKEESGTHKKKIGLSILGALAAITGLGFGYAGITHAYENGVAKVAKLLEKRR